MRSKCCIFAKDSRCMGLLLSLDCYDKLIAVLGWENVLCSGRLWPCFSIFSILSRFGFVDTRKIWVKLSTSSLSARHALD